MVSRIVFEKVAVALGQTAVIENGRAPAVRSA
jgi:hypothetical protein